jgi:hypothetical protein
MWIEMSPERIQYVPAEDATLSDLRKDGRTILITAVSYYNRRGSYKKGESQEYKRKN